VTNLPEISTHKLGIEHFRSDIHSCTAVGAVGMNVAYGSGWLAGSANTPITLVMAGASELLDLESSSDPEA
jgi:hypothetical protein